MIEINEEFTIRAYHMSDAKLVIFNQQSIRRTFHNNEWWFAVADIMSVLTDSLDVKQYIKRMCSRDTELNRNWGTICTPLRWKQPLVEKEP